MTRIELTDADYRMTGLSLNGHTMRHPRLLLSPNAIRTAQDLMRKGATANASPTPVWSSSAGARDGQGIRLSVPRR